LLVSGDACGQHDDRLLVATSTSAATPPPVATFKRPEALPR